MSFDCEVLTHVNRNLWLGGYVQGGVLPSFFDHVISLYPWERYVVRQPIQSEIYVRMLDDTKTVIDVERLNSLADWVDHCQHRGPTLVHCQAGLNRSALVTATALLRRFPEHRATEIISYLRFIRHPAVLCNPAFEKYLVDTYG